MKCSHKSLEKEITWPLRLFLGDRGFLQRYGSQMSLDEVFQLMQLAVRNAPLGLSVSDSLTAEAALRVRDRYCSPILLHTQNLLELGGTKLDITRVAATSREFLLGKINRNLDQDQIIGGFLRNIGPPAIMPYSVDELQSLALDEKAIRYAATLSRQVAPVIVTYGGDWLDLCLIAHRYDLILQVEQLLRMAAPDAILIAFTYLGPICLSKKPLILTRGAGGLLLPVNLLGDGMLPDRERCLRWARRTRLPIGAAHVLALGRIPVLPALDYVFNHEKLSFALVGASTVPHIERLCQAIQRVSENPSLASESGDVKLR